MIDPATLSAAVVTILGKYAIDKLADLGQDMAPQALEKAKEAAKRLYQLTLAHLKSKPESEQIAKEFEEDPETYRKPLEKKLRAALEANATLQAQLSALVEQFERAAQAQLTASVTVNEGAAAVGDGASARSAKHIEGSTVVQGDRNTTVGAGGMYVGGNNSGIMSSGSGNTFTQTTTEERGEE